MALYLVTQNPADEAHTLDDLDYELTAVAQLGVGLAEASGCPVKAWSGLEAEARQLQESVRGDESRPDPEVSAETLEAFIEETDRLTAALRSRFGTDMIVDESLADRVASIYARKSAGAFWTHPSGQKQWTLHPAWGVVQATREFLAKGAKKDVVVIVA